MLHNTSQTSNEDNNILAILDCTPEDDAYSLYEVIASNSNCLF